VSLGTSANKPISDQKIPETRLIFFHNQTDPLPRRAQYSPAFATLLAIQSRPACERWRSFGNFYRDVGKPPSWRHLLIRDDPTGEFSPSNAGWQDCGAVSMGATDDPVLDVERHDPDQCRRSTAAHEFAQ
jgi:hypothetical protein